MSFTIGSLFDGSGGFPLAATMCGGVPVWAAEVEPYPIAVTRSRFLSMKHLGSVTDINGAEIEPVDLITFGSPCQDLSVAGKRAGLKHEDNGDDETTRSGLFMEAVRIIKEMRANDKANGRPAHMVRPRWALWENVPGAFSSNGGEDFRTVLNELIKIAEPEAAEIPAPDKNGWPYADCIVGDGWSLAYRVFDAQYWGVPQRRRRIHLIIDFASERAGEILFKREGLRGYFAEGRPPWQGVAADAEGSSGADDREGDGIMPLVDAHILDDQGGQQIGVRTDGKSPTLRAEMHGNVPCVMQSAGFCPEQSAKTRGIGYEEEVSPTLRAGVTPAVACVMQAAGFPLGFRPENVRLYEETATTLCNGTRPGFTTGVIQLLFENHSQDARYRGPLEVCPMLSAQLGTGGNNQPFVVEKESPVCYAMQAIGEYKESDTASAMKARDYKDATDLVCECADVVCVFDKEVYNSGKNATGGHYIKENGPSPSLRTEHPPGVCVRYIVRRLTPTECARLQGFPDEWGHPDHKADFTDEEYRFWLEVRNTHAAINGKAVKEYTKEQMLNWYNKLHTDSAEYKMWGNGIALPPALYIMQGIAEVMNDG